MAWRVVAILSLTVVLVQGTALPQLGRLASNVEDFAKSSVKAVTSLWDDCAKARSVFQEDPSVVAMLFTAEGCENTKIQIRTGFTELPFYQKNRAEAIVVRPGCICVGFDHASKEGESAAFDNVNGRDFLIMDDLEDDQLDEAISAIDCRCGAEARRNADVQLLTKSGAPRCESSCLKRCNLFVGHFNRADLPGNKKICAVVFDEDDCGDWNKPIVEGFESFSFFSGYRNDIESVMVRPGCTFTGYDHTDKSGNRVVIDGTRQATRQPLFKNLEGKRDLRESISAVECVCRA